MSYASVSPPSFVRPVRSAGLPSLSRLAILGWLLAAAGALLALAVPARGAEITFTQPGLDKWMYPFGFASGNGGTRTTASTFGAVDSPGFDNRDAQFLIGFNTSGGIPTNLGSSAYHVTAARVILTDSAGGYTYDPTYDAFATYRTGGVDTDIGRPIELHGIGFRNGYAAIAFGAGDSTKFQETTAFSPTAQPASASRSVYAMGFDGTGNRRDISNNVDLGYESNPLAVGTITGASPGSTVGVDSVFNFDLNVADPYVQAYLQSALNDGSLGLMASSIMSASQQSASGVPQFYTKENLAFRPDLGSFVAPQLQITYSVPEPASVGVLVAFSMIALIRRPAMSRGRAR